MSAELNPNLKKHYRAAYSSDIRNVALARQAIAGFASEVLVLGVPDVEGNVILLEPEREVPLGVRMF